MRPLNRSLLLMKTLTWQFLVMLWCVFGILSVSYWEIRSHRWRKSRNLESNWDFHINGPWDILKIAVILCVWTMATVVLWPIHAIFRKFAAQEELKNQHLTPTH